MPLQRLNSVPPPRPPRQSENGAEMTGDVTQEGPRIFISAGEASGDLHAANLVRSLAAFAPSAEFAALGGPHLEAAGARLLVNMTEHLAVMGFGAAIMKIPHALRVRREASRKTAGPCSRTRSSKRLRESGAAGRSRVGDISKANSAEVLIRSP